MDFYQEMYESMARDAAEVAAAYGLEVSVIQTHRANIQRFLSENQWTTSADYIQWYTLHRTLPSTGQQVVNFLTAAAEHLWSGAEDTGDEEAARRFSICQECEHLTEEGRCVLCGCFMKIKSRWKEQPCKAGKW